MRLKNFFLMISSAFASLCLILFFFITALNLCAFSNLSFYEKEYGKYHVLDDVQMTMPDLMHVTEHMLDYLSDKEDSLVVETTMFHQQREFFNEREKEHMVDVKILYLNAMLLYKIAIIYLVLFFVGLLSYALYTKKVRQTFALFFKTFLWVLAFCFGVVLLLGLYALFDFDSFWTNFHHVFFQENDLWILDPAEDMLINIVPQGFFFDLVLRIILLFVAPLIVLGIFAFAFLANAKKTAKSMLSLFLCASIVFSITTPASATTNAWAFPEEWPTPPSISSEFAIVLDAKTNAILYEKNATKTAYPASTTKLMTALLTLEHLSLTEKITFSAKSISSLPPGSSHIGMKKGEVLSVKDCLYGLLLPSANEVANALAEQIGNGSLSEFVSLMNQRANALQCVNTSFKNANGLHDEEHYTCAYDLALIFSACLNSQDFRTISSTPRYVIGETNLVKEKRPMSNTNKFLLSDHELYNPSIVCGKTGTTNEAGSCLVTLSENDSLSLIVVVLNAAAPEQYHDTTTLINYAFSNFARQSLSSIEETSFDTFSNLLQNVFEVSFVTSDAEATLTLPIGIDPSSITTHLTNSSGNLLAQTFSATKEYRLGDYVLGHTTIKSNASSFRQLPARRFSPDSADTYVADSAKPTVFFLLIGIAIFLVILLLIYLLFFRKKRRRSASYYSLRF